MALEVLPSTQHPEIVMPLHQHCLAEAGVHIIENLVMDPLIECANKNIHHTHWIVFSV